MTVTSTFTSASPAKCTIGIVGLGLIGGCLAIDFKRLGYTIYGVARRMKTIDAAMDQGIVTEASSDLALMAKAEVVFVCTPMAAILPTVRRLAEHLPESTIVTDVGSVKGKFVETATELWPNFVGGHPMAGKSEAGLAAAEAGLFHQRPYVVTPIDATRAVAVERVIELAIQLGSRVYKTTPINHDQAVATISHLPVMVSSSLLHTCFSEADTNVKTLAQQLASSGFCDTSRVGGGNPELGTMMAQYNRPALLHVLERYRHQLDMMIEIIESEQWVMLEDKLSVAHQERPKYL
ncbi:MAG: prephenate/arogenate dehydrogenase [Leptolyngbya sp. SIO3F4]|nr:prephenate/arogenate dehydrogenase [Leptolyngbya sp. SIO3F4]